MTSIRCNIKVNQSSILFEKTHWCLLESWMLEGYGGRTAAAVLLVHFFSLKGIIRINQV